MNAIGGSSGPLNGVRLGHTAEMSGRQDQETPTSGLRRSHQITDVEIGIAPLRAPEAHTMIDNQEQYLRQAAKANRERLAVAHRDTIMQEQATRAADVRQNMARLKELRLAKETQETRTEIAKANRSARPSSKKRFR
jgi:hypothetical protein